MSAKERDDKVKTYLTDVINNIFDEDETSFQHLEDYKKAEKLLNDLIPVKIDGFRGVVMTAIVGKHLDHTFKPLENFYDCNPRSIYERGIFYVLESFGIPSAKSAPLNVAKAVNKLDEGWISGRKTNAQPIARAAVEFLKLLMSKYGKSDYDVLVNFFFYRLLQYANSIQSYEIVESEPSTRAQNELAEKLVKFVVEYPEAGTVPQVVTGKLLHYIKHSDDQKVFGEEESVFGTNTTSKKPADLWVENELSEVVSLYEITVKKIDYKRLDDCVDAVKNIPNIKDKEIVFICRMPMDIKELNLEDGQTALFHKGYWFNFIDIQNFIFVSLTLMDSSQIESFFLEMNSFLSDINRPIITKEGWNAIFA